AAQRRDAARDAPTAVPGDEADGALHQQRPRRDRGGGGVDEGASGGMDRGRRARRLRAGARRHVERAAEDGQRDRDAAYRVGDGAYGARKPPPPRQRNRDSASRQMAALSSQSGRVAALELDPLAALPNGKRFQPVSAVA